MYNRVFKKILPTVILLSAGLSFVFPSLLSPALADSGREIYFEDFSYDYAGEKPYTLNVQEMDGSTARIVRTKGENGKYKNMLKLTDEKEKSIASASLSVPDYKNSVTLEMKFKLTKTTTPGYGFIIDFLGNSRRALRMYKHSGEQADFAIENSGGTSSVTCGLDMNNEWFTLKINLNSKRKVSSLALENVNYGLNDYDTLQYNYCWQDKQNKRLVFYNQTWFNEYAGGNLTDIQISTYGVTAGEVLIDYIALYETSEEYYPEKIRAKSKPMEVTPSPKMRLVPGTVNVVYYDEVLYFANPSYIKNKTVLSNAEKIAGIYGLDASFDKNSCTLSKKGVSLSFTKDKDTFLYNGSEIKLDTPCETAEDIFYIPVKNIAETLGDSVSSDIENQVIYITEKTIFQIEGCTGYATIEETLKNGMFVIAGYDNQGKLLDFSYTDGEFKKGSKLDLSLDNSLNYSKIAVYLWDKDNLIPCCKPLMKQQNN